MSEARYLVGDVFERMAELPDGSVDLIVTSPPFLALRSYLPADHPDKAKEIGSEPTPAVFLSTLLALTREWRRVLAPHGSLCVELGDTYSGSGGGGGDYDVDGWRDGQQRPTGSGLVNRGRKRAELGIEAPDRTARGPGWPLAKSLCLLPTLYPASLAYGRNLLETGLTPEEMLHHIDLWIKSGISAADAIRMAHDWLPQRRQYWDEANLLEPWRVRNQIVWHRPNPPVGALGDKVRPSTSYVTVACTSRTRWFDLDAERSAPAEHTQRYPRDAEHYSNDGYDVDSRGDGGRIGSNGGNPAGAPPLDCWLDTTPDDVWTLSTQPYKGSHYATFPITLPRKLINLMCPRQVCVVCGEPRRRITETQVLLDGKPTDDYLSINRMGERTGAVGVDHNRFSTDRNTVGWTDCGCRFDPVTGDITGTGPIYRRGIVLDPFAGSGTTLVAASELGRDSIGIDIDERNLDLARQRCGMFLIEPEAVS